MHCYAYWRADYIFYIDTSGMLYHCSRQYDFFQFLILKQVKIIKYLPSGYIGITLRTIYLVQSNFQDECVSFWLVKQHIKSSRTSSRRFTSCRYYKCQKEMFCFHISAKSSLRLFKSSFNRLIYLFVCMNMKLLSVLAYSCQIRLLKIGKILIH